MNTPEPDPQVPTFEPNAYEYKLVANSDARKFELACQAALDAGFLPLSRLRLDYREHFVREFYRRKDAAKVS